MEKLIELELEKRKEIVNTFDKNYLLEAGAGAGKTTIIVDRIINHIRNEKIDPKNMVAITFTKAASLELAERIERKALECISTEENEASRKSLERVEELFSGTIHSFCDMLLREMPFEAGLTPGYEIVEDSGEFYEEIWYEFLRNKKEEYRDYVESLRNFNIDYKDLKSGAISAMDNPDIEFTGFNRGENYEEVENRFNLLDVNGLQGDFIKQNSNLGRFLVEIIGEKKSLGSYVNVLLKECPKIDLELDMAARYIKKPHLEKEGAKDIISTIEDLVDIYNSLNGLIYDTCTDFVKLVAKYKEDKYSNYLTFNDLLYKACQLIKTSDKARAHFRSKYRYFYIDEAQDTDPLQAELLLLLSHEGDINHIRSFADIEPQDGSLFIVADPKQSIYRFRRADINIYESLKSVINKSGEVVNLDINFRSTNTICTWVEDSFKDRRDGFAFLKDATDIQAKFERILTFWKQEQEEASNQLAGVYKYKISPEKNNGDQVESESKDVLEAIESAMVIKEEEYVAHLVKEIIDTKYIDEKTKDGIINRKVENKDILLLTKTNKETGIYLEELKRNNIPALLAGEKKLSDNREVLNLFLLIDFLVDSRDDIKFTAVLKNCFNLDIETINLLFKDGKRKNAMFDEDKFKEIRHPHLKEAIFYLKDIFTKSKLEDPIVFLERVIADKIGVYDTYKDYKQVEKRDADSSLIQTMEILKAKEAISLYEIKEEFKELMDKEINYELPINLDFAEDAVRVMNMHKSKGLEANIVLLVGWDKKRETLPHSYHIDKKDGKNLGYIIYKNDLLILSPDERERKEEEERFKEAELDRLIYVAATRAKSVLILANVENEKMFLYPLNENVDKELILKTPDSKLNQKGLSDRKIEEIKITKDIVIKNQLSQPRYKKLSPSKNSEDQSSKSYYNSTIKKPSPRGKCYGTMVHRAFEIVIEDAQGIKAISQHNIDYAINLSIKENLESIDLDEDILKLLAPNIEFDLKRDSLDKIKREVTDSLSSNLRQVIKSFLENDDIKELFSNTKAVYTEFPFFVYLDQNEEEEVPSLVSGEIDLLIQKEDNSLIIVDYKTDMVDEDLSYILKDRYRSQLEIYKKSLKLALNIGDLEVETIYIYSTYLDQVINLQEIVLA